MTLGNESWVTSEKWTDRRINVILENWVEGAEELRLIGIANHSQQETPLSPLKAT